MNSNKYVLTIIFEDKIENINLLEFNKNIITFGKNMNNDIVILSPLMSENHGYIKIDNENIIIVDNNSENGIYVNDNRVKEYILKDNDTIKIYNPMSSNKSSVLGLTSFNKILPQWQICTLKEKEFITIGRSEDNDIVLDRVSVSLKQAKIYKENNNYVLGNYNTNTGIIYNDRILDGPQKLKNKDLFIIDNVKFIYNDEKILYQNSDYGVSLNAIDITKTVKIKGKYKDIAQHVNFQAKPGEFISFVGISGAGKSTFLKCISGVTLPTKGKVLLNGKDFYKNKSVLKNLVGYVPQENILFDDLILIDMLKYSADLRMPEDTTIKEKEKRINEVLKILELEDKKDILIKKLSGGQKKRAGIAIELLADPKIFFLDEPTSGLDPGTERNIMEILRKLANNGKTIILVTHNTLNLHLCDKVVFFGLNGKLCYDGSPKQALEFFNVDDFVEIYKLLNKDTDKWHELFKEKTFKNVLIDEEITDSENQIKSKSYIKQLITLLKRKFKLLKNNKQQLILLFLQVPFIAFLISLVVTDEIFYSYEETKSIIFMISTAAIWLGLLNSIQEVCKEITILKKEYMNDLKISAYMSSKLIYLFIISVIQSTLMVLSISLFMEVPQEGVYFSWKFEIFLTCLITILSSSSMGLFVSILTKNSASAMTMPTILLVPQLLFSGMLFPLKGIVKFISNFIICRWSVEAMGTTNDFNNLVSKIQEIMPSYNRESEEFYIFSLQHYGFDILMLLLITVIIFLLSYSLLKRKLESGN